MILVRLAIGTAASGPGLDGDAELGDGHRRLPRRRPRQGRYGPGHRRRGWARLAAGPPPGRGGPAAPRAPQRRRRGRPAPPRATAGDAGRRGHQAGPPGEVSSLVDKRRRQRHRLVRDTGGSPDTGQQLGLRGRHRDRVGIGRRRGGAGGRRRGRRPPSLPTCSRGRRWCGSGRARTAGPRCVAGRGRGLRRPSGCRPARPRLASASEPAPRLCRPRCRTTPGYRSASCSSSSGAMSTARAFDPSEGPTTPRRSRRSIRRPALEKPTRSLRCNIDVDPS